MTRITDDDSASLHRACRDGKYRFAHDPCRLHSPEKDTMDSREPFGYV